MDFNDTEIEAAFRAEARAWLANNAPRFVLDPHTTYDESQLATRGRQWQRAKAEAGLGAILAPCEIGGRAGTQVEEVIFSEEEARYRLPLGPFIGIGLHMAVPTLLRHGSSEQRARLLAPTIRGELTWCQLFSEPGAGSDLAAVGTRAVREGTGWLVNGQKVWSSWARYSDWGLLLARTDPSVAKHKGLTYFALDMKAAGITVRPIRQISGKSDFNETFLVDVRIPDADRIGAVGEGWKVAMTTLMSERLGGGADGDYQFDQVLTLARNTLTGGKPAIADASVRQKLARWYAQEQGLRHFRARLLTQLSKGGTLGAEVALSKLVYARKLQEMMRFAMDLQEYAGVIAPTATSQRQIFDSYYWSAALRIAGGTDEILRNQLAERVLGLPGEIRGDKDLPFEQLPRSR